MINIQIPKQIEGERIILSVPPLDFKTATTIYQIINRNRAYLRKWLMWVDHTQSPEDIFKFLQSVQTAFETKTKGEYTLIEKATGDICGFCGMHVHNKPENQHMSIGYWQDPAKCGHGYMREAVQLMENFCFSQNVMRLIIENDTENLPSINIPKKLGYHLDGVMRAAYYSNYFQNYRDKNVWSKLNPALQKQRG